MIVLVVRLGMGKIVFVLNIVKNVVLVLGNKFVKKVVFFIFEMFLLQLVICLFGISIEIDLYKFKKLSELLQDELDKIIIY